MEEVQSWLTNNYFLSKSSPPLISSSVATFSHETHTTPTLCEDISSSNTSNLLEYNNSSTQTTPSSHSSQNNYSCIASLNTLSPRISCLALHTNNTLLYAASTNEINVFDLSSPTYSVIDTFGSGSGLVKSIAFSHDNKIFTAHQDCKIRVWKQVNMNHTSRKLKHQLISTLPTLKDRVLNSLLEKNYVQVRRHKKKLWIQHTDAVSGLVVGSNSGLMYSISWDKYFKIWNISESMKCLESMKAHSDAINAIIVDSVDGTVYTGSADGKVKVWKMCDVSIKHKLLTTLEKHESSVNALALGSSNGTRLLYSGGRDSMILVWEKGDSEDDYMMVASCLKGHKGAILCLVYLNGVVISGSSDKTLRIWKHGKDFGFCCLAILEGHNKPIKSLVAVSDDEDDFSIFSGCLDGEIRVWKVSISDDIQRD